MAEEPKRSSLAAFGLLVFLLAIAFVLAAGAVFFIVSERSASVAGPRPSPLSAIQAGAINPAIALASLAGQDDQAVLDRALAAGSSDTALATLLYSTALSDQARSAGLAALARSLAQGKKTKDDALAAARTAADIALLSPTLPDYNRATILDQSGQVMAGLGEKDDALHAYEAAGLIAADSGRIDPAYRRVILEALAADAGRLGNAGQVRTLRSALQAEPPPADNRPAVLPTLIAPIQPGASVAWSELEQATAQRTSLANDVMASLAGGARSQPDGARQALEKALVAEDQLRTQLFTSELAASNNLLQRVALARAQVDWLALKLRIARQGFGVSLVPGWESQTAEIEASLRQACQDYYLILRDTAASLPESSQAIQATVETILDQIKLGRLGLPPSEQEADLLRSLDEANRRLLELGGTNLYVTGSTEQGSNQLSIARYR